MLLIAAHVAVLVLLGAQLQASHPGKAKPLWASLTLWLRPPELPKPPDKPKERQRREPPAAAAPAAVTQDLPPSSEPHRHACNQRHASARQQRHSKQQHRC